MLLEILNSGTTRIIPINIAPASKTFLILNCSLKNRGSRKVTNKGKVENVTSPTATLEI